MALGLKYLICDTDRYGATRYYVRMPGRKKCRILHDPNTKSFKQAYQRIVSGLPAIDIAAPIVTAPHLHAIHEPITLIYIISAHKTTKVGITNDIKKRLSSLQTGLAGRIKLHFLFECNQAEARKLERYVHRDLRDFHLSGEWFSCHPTRAMAALEDRAKALGVTVRTAATENIRGTM